MDEVVQSIQRVTQVMQTINTNAAEQRDGVAQVNEAVGALDQMTQQNAALVEESAAAAHSLREQSEQLRTLVQRFKVHPHTAGQAVPQTLAATPAAPAARPPQTARGPHSLGVHAVPLPRVAALAAAPAQRHAASALQD
jgi:ABC-type transporter Mla subunit MlaD